MVLTAECVTLAETNDHLNWELIGEIVKRLTGEPARVLRAAHKEVEEEEDEHLYHNTGWGPRAVDRRPWHARRPPPTRRAKGRQDRHRRRPSQARPARYDLTARHTAIGESSEQRRKETKRCRPNKPT
jgi:hypothetical protein